MTDDDIKKIGQLMDDKLAASEQRVVTDIGKFMEDSLFPLIEEKADKTDIDRLESRFDDFTGKVAALNTRVRNIEATSTVAHELKHKI